MKPIIGILPLWDDERDSYWMLPGYMDGTAKANGIPIMLPMTENKDDIERFIDVCDGFLFTGGHDVDPQIYGCTAKFNNIEPCEKRDKTELLLLKAALENDKPILGICRGIQFINAALGGTLYQDLPIEYDSKTEHHQTPPYDVPIHSVDITHNTPLYTLLHKDKIEVNSYHHQAVKTLAPELETMAVSEDGLIEAIYIPNKRFVWALQWHPEFSYKSDKNSQKIFEAFVSACK